MQKIFQLNNNISPLMALKEASERVVCLGHQLAREVRLISDYSLCELNIMN